MRFQLIPKSSTTLDDLKQPISTLLQKRCVFSDPTTKYWMKIHPHYHGQKC